MKKIIMFLTFLTCMIFSQKVYAEGYTEWSTEIPENDKIIQVLTSKRYLYYKLNKVDKEYLTLENEKDECDLNDYIYTEYKTSEEFIESTESREVITEIGQFTRFYYDVKYIKVNVTNAPLYGVRIKGISIYDLKTNEPIEYTMSSFNNIVSLNLNDYLIYQGGNIVFELKDINNGEEIGITYTLVVNQTESKYYRISMLDEDNNENFYRIVKYDNNETILFNDYVNYPIWSIRGDIFDKIIYKYRDKLYNCYNLEKEELGYYENLEGDYLKEENPVTFYSYKILETLNEDCKCEETICKTEEIINNNLPVQKEVNNGLKSYTE
ncbi:hypothetical protein EOM09_07395, partial [bacterium]|nr:hypothetical protein [bacterium]